MKQKDKLKKLTNEIVHLFNTNDDNCPSTSLELIENWLKEVIRDLIETDITGLMQLLYRIDVSEEKVKTAIENTNIDADEMIAKLIIDRQLRKIEWREKIRKESPFKNDEDNLVERWD